MTNELRNVLLSFAAVALMVSFSRGHYEKIAYAQNVSVTTRLIDDYEGRFATQEQEIHRLTEEKNEMAQEIAKLAALLKQARAPVARPVPVSVPQPIVAGAPPVGVKTTAPQPVRVKTVRRTRAS